jgi:N4-(beta-N-acetylglucosaminyl)-L-asparaginase
MTTINRRAFVAASGAALAASMARARSVSIQPAEPAKAAPGDGHRGPCFIASGNGERVTAKAMELNNQGVYLLDAIVAGIKIVEDDPNDDSVGYGGLPNEEGVVQLDSSIMDGPTHRAGSVGALENIKNPAAVALLVLRRTGHVMLVGAGALKFAKQMGFQGGEPADGEVAAGVAQMEGLAQQGGLVARRRPADQGAERADQVSVRA